MTTKTPRELIAECAEQLSTDGHYELAREIAALKAAQPVPAAPYQVPDGWQLVPPEPDESMFRAVTHLDYTSQTDVGWIEGYRCMLAAAPKAAAAPYQVTDEDVVKGLDIYYGDSGLSASDEPWSASSLEDMRNVLENYEARKAAA